MFIDMNKKKGVYDLCFSFILIETCDSSKSIHVSAVKSKFLNMVVETDNFEEYNGIEFRDNQEEPRVMSVSAYGDLQCKAAHEELIQASKSLLPLADYIEENFAPDYLSPSNEVNGVDEKRCV